jgi:hypothetical protein
MLILREIFHQWMQQYFDYSRKMRVSQNDGLLRAMIGAPMS